MRDIFHGTNGQMVLIGAHRYALGRATYAVSCIAEWLLAQRHLIESASKFVMVRDTIEALNHDLAGMDCDVAVWRHFVTELRKDLSPEQQKNLEELT